MFHITWSTVALRSKQQNMKDEWRFVLSVCFCGQNYLLLLPSSSVLSSTWWWWCVLDFVGLFLTFHQRRDRALLGHRIQINFMCSHTKLLMSLVWDNLFSYMQWCVSKWKETKCFPTLAFWQMEQTKLFMKTQAFFFFHDRPLTPHGATVLGAL